MYCNCSVAIEHVEAHRHAADQCIGVIEKRVAQSGQRSAIGDLKRSLAEAVSGDFPVEGRTVRPGVCMLMAKRL